MCARGDFSLTTRCGIIKAGLMCDGPTVASGSMLVEQWLIALVVTTLLSRSSFYQCLLLLRTRGVLLHKFR